MRNAGKAGALTAALICTVLAAAPGMSAPAVSAPPGALSVPFAPVSAGPRTQVSLQDAAGREVAKASADGGQLSLGEVTPGRVFPAACRGASASLPGLLVGTVTVGSGPGAATYRPVPAGLQPGAEPSGAPGKGAALLFLKSASKGRVQVDCSQKDAGAFDVALDGSFPAGWSRVRVTVSVERGAQTVATVRLTPEAGGWRWERAAAVQQAH